MSARLKQNLKGDYRFLPGIEPYSSGVVAEPGHEIVHVTLTRPLAWHAGLFAVRRYLESIGRERHSLCGVELRCPKPFSIDGFRRFNTDYRALLEEWNLLVDGENPVARTNVAPVVDPPGETILYGFSYTVPGESALPTFVVAGGGELREGGLERDLIVCVGETTEDALLEKAVRVAEIMCQRLASLGNNDLLSTIDVYTQHQLQSILSEVLIPALPAAARLGVRWFLSRPPVKDIEFEMDMRGVRRDIMLDLSGVN